MAGLDEAELVCNLECFEIDVWTWRSWAAIGRPPAHGTGELQEQANRTFSEMSSLKGLRRNDD
jgi:hypothetical protein